MSKAQFIKTKIVKRKRNDDEDQEYDVSVKDTKRSKTSKKKSVENVEMKKSKKSQKTREKCKVEPEDRAWIFNSVGEETKAKKEKEKAKEKKRKHKSKAQKVKKEKKAKAPEIKTKVFDGPKFNVLDADERRKSREFLLEHGFVVVYNMADAKQVASIKNKAFDFMHQANPHFDPNDTTTWTNANTPGMFGTGILFEDGIGQSPAMWEARILPTFRTWFGEYYDTQELLTSFDGMAFIRGAEHRFVPNRAWLHTDQDMMAVPELGYSVQCALNLVDCKNPYDSGSFLVIDKSHLEMQRRLVAGLETKNMSSLKRHFYKLANNHDFYKQVAKEETPALLVPALAGEAVYWLSTTVHANYAPTTSVIKNTERRLVTFVAMAPLAHFPTPMGRLGRASIAASKQVAMTNANANDREPEYKKIVQDQEKQAKKTTELDHFRKQRRVAAAQGMTTSHWPTAAPAQPTRAYPRCASFATMTRPLVCLKTVFCPAEEALLFGTAPYENDD